jgi:bifunctional non-homologous end joining protein LigD
MDGSDDVPLTNLDQPLFEDAGATKRDLVDYFEAVSEQLLGELRGRPLSVVRALRGQKPFMQKNVPTYAPPWVKTVTIWAESSKREVAYALCNDWPTLLWFANQRAIEYHPTLARGDSHDFVQTHLVLDLDPPADGGFEGQGVARVRARCTARE